MPFEPRLIPRDDEPEEDLELPADLRELADQLSADASHLAEKYPAPGYGAPSGRAEAVRATALRLAMALAALAAGLYGVTRVSWQTPQGTSERTPVATADPVLVPALVQPAAFFQ